MSMFLGNPLGGGVKTMRKLGIWYPETAKDIQDVYDPFMNFTYERMFMFPESEGDYVASSANCLFESIEDGDPVVKTFNDFTVPKDITVTTSNRCKGLYLKILGNLTINGTLSMTARGAHAEGRYVGVTDDFVAYCVHADELNLLKDLWLTTIGAIGGIGDSQTSTPGANGACGAGGYNDCYYYDKYLHAYIRGGNGTSFSGGAGASGGTVIGGQGRKIGLAGSDEGGQGGNGIDNTRTTTQWSRSGSGAGNPSGSVNNAANAGANGTGGLLILLVHGDIVINGHIESNGSKGGNGTSCSATDSYQAYGGSGSGGGAIHIFHKKLITGIENISVDGGSGGDGSTTNQNRNYTGKAGGKGTINMKKI